MGVGVCVQWLRVMALARCGSGPWPESEHGA